MLSCLLLPDFDPGHDVISYRPSDSDGNEQFGRRALSSFTRWDAARFLGLARDPTIRSIASVKTKDAVGLQKKFQDAEEGEMPVSRSER